MARDLNSPLSGRVTSRFGGSGRHRNKILVGIATAAVVPFLLSTFAASVTVGSGQLDFGQGSQQAIACDSQVYVALNQEWHSAPTATDATAGFFRVRSVTISNLDLVACKNTKLRIRLIDATGHEIQLGAIPGANVLQISLPNTDQPVSISDPAALGLTYLTSTGDPISGTMPAQISLSTSGVSVYDGSTLTPNNADATFYIDPSQQVNIDGSTVGRVTVETVNNPKASA
jgi:hypothetical protein